MAIDGPLLLIGCGKMGSAMLLGWLVRDIRAEDVTVVEPNAAARTDIAGEGVAVVGDAAQLPPGFAPSVVVLAVKPQMMDAAIAPLARFARPGTVFLSIAAGKTIGYFERQLGGSAAIVRSMPNTPAAILRGITVACANRNATTAQRAQCDELLVAVGEVAWVEDEGLLDAVTAVSGGGPAYVFLLIECLAEAGVAAGLPPGLAMRLASATVSGSGDLVRKSSQPASVLRQNVTSPGGTTLEALKILMAADGLQPLLTKAIAAATRRSRELAR
jgi:pyrroline-5-carboxylate reductase